MSKKFGKFLLFSAVAGAAAYGAYQYLQKKDKATVLSGKEEEDDPDDFSEDLDEEPAPSKERSYVSLIRQKPLQPKLSRRQRKSLPTLSRR